MSLHPLASVLLLGALSLGACGRNQTAVKNVQEAWLPITVMGQSQLRNQFSGRVTLRFALEGQEAGNVQFDCAVSGPSANGTVNCKDGTLELNLDAYNGEHTLTTTAVKAADQRPVGKTTLGFCSGASCQEKATDDAGKDGAGDGAKDDAKQPSAPRPPVTDGIPGAGITNLPPGIPSAGTVFNIPIGIPTVKINVGRFWTMFLPPRYHIISSVSDKTFEGPSTIEYAQVMDDVYTRSPFCTPNTHENGQIVTLLDGYGEPYSYCLSYFSEFEDFQFQAGRDRAVNSLEFSSPGADPATYERFYMAAHEVRDSFSGPQPLSRFENFCAGAYSRGEAQIAIINNWWNDPLGLRPTRVFWCSTNMSGFGAGFDVWVAGFLFEEKHGASNNAAKATIEMTYVVSAEGLPSTFNPNIILSGAAYRVSAMLLQTGLNAPFNSYNP